MKLTTIVKNGFRGSQKGYKLGYLALDRGVEVFEPARNQAPSFWDELKREGISSEDYTRIFVNARSNPENTAFALGAAGGFVTYCGKAWCEDMANAVYDRVLEKLSQRRR